MKLQFKTLSPIHIGTGEELAPLDYVVHDRVFYRISQDQLEKLTKSLLPETGVRDLGDWISDQYLEMSHTSDNRDLSKMNDRMNAYYFFETKRKGRELIRAMQGNQFGIKGTPVTLDERTKSRNRNETVIPLGQVRGIIKNGQGQPYIPGSSLKGSLRTALLFHYLNTAADKRQLERLIHDQLGKRERKERFALPLNHEAFYCATKDIEKNRLKTDDEKMDLLKLVRISDAHIAPTDNSIHLAKMNIYLVEKQETKSNSKQQSDFKATQQPQASYCEVIPKGKVIETELDFDIDFLVQAKKFLRDGGIPAGGDIQWIGIEKKVKWLFNLDLATLNEQNKEEKRTAVIQHLLDCWGAFSRRQIAAHEGWLDHFGKNDPRDEYTSRIRNGMHPVLSRAQKQLIHLGYATGFHGTTAILYFLEDQRLVNLYKMLLETFGIGNKPGNKGSYKVNMERFPKSRRLLEDERTILPLGWLQWMDGSAEDRLEDSKEDVAISPMATATPPPPAEPVFFKGELNHKKPPELDAVVTVSGRPNKVKVYIRPDYTPEIVLTGYANPLEVGTVIVVRSQVSGKGVLLQVSFGRKK